MESSWRLAFRDAARALAARRRREDGDEEAAVDEAGFTLIELMVVLLIMGILMAIAIPTFLGAASGAHDKASQSDLTNSMTSAKTVYASNGTYTVTTGGVTHFVTSLTKAEPEMSFNTGSITAGATGKTTGATRIGVKVLTTGKGLELVSYSASTHNCWYAVDNENGSGVTMTANGAAATPGISYALVSTVTSYTGCTFTAALTKTWSRTYPKT